MARYLMLRLLGQASEQRVAIPALTSTDYVNFPSRPGWSRGSPATRSVERRYRGVDPGESVHHGAPCANDRVWAWVAISRPARRPRRSGSVSTTIPHEVAQATIRCSSVALGITRLEGRLKPPSSSAVPPGTQPYRRRVCRLLSAPRLMPDFWESPTVSIVWARSTPSTEHGFTATICTLTAVSKTTRSTLRCFWATADGRARTVGWPTSAR